MLHCRYTTKKNAPLISDAFQPAKGGLRTLWFSPPIPSVDWVTGAGFFFRAKKRNVEVTRAFEGRKRQKALAAQTLLSTIAFARSPRALYQRNKQKTTGACHEGVPGLLPKSCKWPTVGPADSYKNPSVWLKICAK